MAQVDHCVAQAEALGQAVSAIHTAVSHLAALHVEPVAELGRATTHLSEASYWLAVAAKTMRHDAQRKAAGETAQHVN